jgi:hypothetical protein
MDDFEDMPDFMVDDPRTDTSYLPEEGNEDMQEEKVDERLQLSHDRYDSKNEYLRSSALFREIDTDMFLHLLFCRGDEFEMLPFEEEWCEAYEWWTENNAASRSSKRPANYSYVYNGIAQAIYGKRQKDNKNKTFVITSRAEKMHEILAHPFVIMSPISYTGKRRLKSNARYLYAIAIDIDSVDGENIDNLMFQSDPKRPHITFPQPNIIVNSGNGIHVYYLLESPAPMFKDAYPILNKIKRELTRRVWNIGTTHEDPRKPQYQGNCQGFRLPGTQTKFYTKVTAFQNINPNVKPYYSISDLAYGGGGWITDAELELVKKGTYNPSRVTLNQARELYPDWYERRILQGHAAGRWYIKRDLYDWWKDKISKYASVGHRYFCLMALSVYAKKCDIPEEEFRKDLEGFVEIMNALSYTKKPEDQFTIEDAIDASAAYQENYCTFPLDDIKAITGIDIQRNLTRKFRKQKEHLKRAALVRDGLYTDWTIGKGRNRKQESIFEWRQEHPEGTKYACAKELGISKPTVMRWWDSTAEDIQAEQERKKALKEMKLMPADSSNISHTVGATSNAPYLKNKAVMGNIMSYVPGSEKLSHGDRQELNYDLADAVDFSYFENLYKRFVLGVPENLLSVISVKPEVVEKFRDEMIAEMQQQPDFSEDMENLDQFMKEHPEIQQFLNYQEKNK